MAVASEEAEKNKASKEVIRSQTEQVKKKFRFCYCTDI